MSLHSYAQEQAGFAESRDLREQAEARLTARILKLAADPEAGGPTAIARSVGVSDKVVIRILRANGVPVVRRAGP